MTHFKCSIRAAVLSLMCLTVLSAATADAGATSKAILDSFGRQSGLFVVIGCGDGGALRLAAELGANGDSLVHAIAGDLSELAAFNQAIAKANVKGCVTAEMLDLKTLPYRDYLVNVIVIMDLPRAKALGLAHSEAVRCLAPYGRLVVCEKGSIKKITEIPLPKSMDIWTHRYHSANGIPVSTDTAFDLPVGFKWNAGLPMNFDNPERGANRYSSTRALVLDHGCCYTFSTGVYENLGGGWRSEYGTDQYLTCRDAFNGRIIWRKLIGGTFYGGLYIENMAPLVSEGDYLFTAGENGKMLCVDAKTGKTVRELPTKYIPGVIVASDGIVVAGTWKDGKIMGSIKHYDRRRMDWEIGEGTIEAYAADSGKLLWKKDRLGTAVLIDSGLVFAVSRTGKDALEKNHSKPKGDELKRPAQKVIAMDLKSGKILWEAEDKSFNIKGQAINLEAAGHGAVAVAYNGRKSVALLSAKTGKVLDAEATKQVESKFFRYRNHICTPVFKTPNITLANRGGTLQKQATPQKAGMNVKFGGARAGCLTGTVPGYGAGYITQNWCRCSPGQIPGLLTIAPIGRMLTPEEMEAPAVPVAVAAAGTTPVADSAMGMWSSFRGNAERSSSASCDIPAKIAIAWSKKLTADRRPGTVARDWRAYLNSRLTAPVVSGDLAIVGDLDHNETIAFSVADGSARWRYMAGGRMDTAPTVYRGMCLIADHAGYVSAVDVKTGKLLYKLR
ncbi:PQQ-binding-like beta-propeller repeat protein, partial [bacterium]|nr:PQQ-binding-like beta-propeller repeat protein [bacterium]